MKEWTYEQAVEIIYTCIMDGTSEDSINDDEAMTLAKKIAKALECDQ